MTESLSLIECSSMTDVSLKIKQAYFAKVKRANYKASMRLEGLSSPDSETRVTKESILARYRRSGS